MFLVFDLDLGSFWLSFGHATNATVQEEHHVGNDVQEDHEDVAVSSERSAHTVLHVKEESTHYSTVHRLRE